jgi:tetraacyldisaccharide 4'-kinase
MISLLLSFLTSCRNILFDKGIFSQKTLPSKVISVGNIAVGGTGKTPFVIALVKQLQIRGASPAVLTRGYGAGLKKNEWVVLRNGALVGGNTTPQQLPDEARLQSIECPNVAVIAGANRFAAAQAYLQAFSNEQEPTHWVLDDGFQHRRIRRDIDIVLLDKSNPVGSGWLLPFGFLREPVSSIKRATHVFLTGNGERNPAINQSISEVKSNLLVVEVISNSAKIDTDVRGAIKFSQVDQDSVFVVAGIARPERFLQDLKLEGIVPAKKLFLPDHHAISSATLTQSLGASSAVITTAKDYWRNPDVFLSLKIPVFVKKIEIVLPDSLVEQFF